MLRVAAEEAGGTASAKVPVERCPTASILDGVREAVLWAP